MRKIMISTKTIKEINKFDNREKQWIKAIIGYLEDESHSLDMIKLKFRPLSNELEGYHKAKHRGFGLRIIFRILDQDEIQVFIDKRELDESVNEIIQIITAGKRDKIYDLAIKKIKNR